MKNYSKANLGMSFEQLIIAANEFYLLEKTAAIIKVPTSMKVVRKFDPVRKRSDIVSAFPEEKSTVDFVGQYKNMPIWFEAKSTSNKRSFPLSKIAEHQIDWLDKVGSMGGVAFILFEITEQRAYYRMTYKQLKTFMADHDRKSIPFEFFEKFCQKVNFNRFGVLDYLNNLKFERGI